MPKPSMIDVKHPEEVQTVDDTLDNCRDLIELAVHATYSPDVKGTIGEGLRTALFEVSGKLGRVMDALDAAE